MLLVWIPSSSPGHDLGYNPLRQEILDLDLLAFHCNAVQMQREVRTDVTIGQQRNMMEEQDTWDHSSIYMELSPSVPPLGVSPSPSPPRSPSQSPPQSPRSQTPPPPAGGLPVPVQAPNGPPIRVAATPPRGIRELSPMDMPLTPGRRPRSLSTTTTI